MIRVRVWTRRTTYKPYKANIYEKDETRVVEFGVPELEGTSYARKGVPAASWFSLFGIPSTLSESALLLFEGCLSHGVRALVELEGLDVI